MVIAQLSHFPHLLHFPKKQIGNCRENQIWPQHHCCHHNHSKWGQIYQSNRKYMMIIKMLGNSNINVNGWFVEETRSGLKLCRQTTKTFLPPTTTAVLLFFSQNTTFIEMWLPPKELKPETHPMLLPVQTDQDNATLTVLTAQLRFIICESATS